MQLHASARLAPKTQQRTSAADVELIVVRLLFLMLIKRTYLTSGVKGLQGNTGRYAPENAAWN